MAEAEMVDVDAVGEVAQAPARSQDDEDVVEMETNEASAQARPAHSKDDGDDDEEEDEERADETGLRWKKERIAIVFGYIGARFQGLQRNPGAFTVEDELESAIFRAGGITSEPSRQRGTRGAAGSTPSSLPPEQNVGDFHKIGWNRAARTDKGVHAMGQARPTELPFLPRSSRCRR